MSLIGNGFRHNTIGKFYGVGVLDGAYPSAHEYVGHLAGAMRNQFAGEGITDDLASVPNGARHPVAWVMAPKNGGMASRNVTTLDIATSGLAYGGVNIDGSTTITISFDPAAGQLISSGSGSASMSFTFANALLTASLNGIGSTSFTLTTNTPLLGAETSVIGSASFAFTGTLTPYAIGNMVGTTDVVTDVVNANIVSVNGYAVTGDGQTGTEWGPQ